MTPPRGSYWWSRGTASSQRRSRHEILAIDVLGASTFSIALYTTTDGLVDGTRIISTHSDTNPAGGANTDGTGSWATYNLAAAIARP